MLVSKYAHERARKTTFENIWFDSSGSTYILSLVYSLNGVPHGLDIFLFNFYCHRLLCLYSMSLCVGLLSRCAQSRGLTDPKTRTSDNSIKKKTHIHIRVTSMAVRPVVNRAAVKSSGNLSCIGKIVLRKKNGPIPLTSELYV